MRIGVICEGPTDWHAIKSFLGDSISSAGFSVELVPLQPDPDATSSEGGWTKVLLWLKSHLPKSRIQQLFAKGLFGGGLATEPLDGILIQLDSDILGNDSFGALVEKQHCYTVANPAAAEQHMAMLNAATSLDDVATPPSNKLKKLSGNRQGQHSIRINRQWRICFRWDGTDAHDVEIVDYH